jgi:predicted TIM-barrel fold metal-dependent hydrolase
MGADGIKMLEGKPSVRKRLGIPLSSSVYQELYAFLEAEGIPILLHVADPDTFWDPRKVPEAARSCGCFYGTGEHPTKEELLEEVEEILQRFHSLNMILAHFCFLSNDMDRASRMLESFPHVSFDITPGWEMYEDFSKEPEKWRGFFRRYQDRIIFGTDNSGRNGKGRGSTLLEAMDKVGRIRKFLETDGPMFSGRGLRLDRSVLEKIYRENFLRIAGSCPRKMP